MRTIRALIACLCIAFVGCSESNSDAPDSGRRDAGGGGTDSGPASTEDAGGGGTDAGGGGTDGGLPRDGGGSSLPIVVNEIRPSNDFVELVNPTSAAVSLDGYQFTDGAELETPPDTSHRTPFPAGLSLAPGEHFVIVMNTEDAATSGMLSSDSTACLGAPRCMLLEYGIGGGGDSALLLDASNAVVARADFPGDSAGLMSGESYCRFPDVTGDFARCASTPGAPNALP